MKGNSSTQHPSTRTQTTCPISKALVLSSTPKLSVMHESYYTKATGKWEWCSPQATAVHVTGRRRQVKCTFPHQTFLGANVSARTILSHGKQWKKLFMSYHSLNVAITPRLQHFCWERLSYKSCFFLFCSRKSNLSFSFCPVSQS